MLILMTLVSLAFAADDAVADAVDDSVQVRNAAPDAVDVLDPSALQAAAERELDYGETYASLAPSREHLRTLLASKTWESGPSGTAQVNLREPLSVVEPLLDARAPTFTRAKAALASRVTDQEDEEWWQVEWTRSNYKVERGADGQVLAVAFGVQHATQGRGIHRTSLDVLVTYDKGRPTEVFTATTGSWGRWFQEHHYTLTADADGRVVALDEVHLTGTDLNAGGEKLLRGEKGTHSPKTTAVARRWTRT